MNKYIVFATQISTCSIEIEADSEEAAIEKSNNIDFENWEKDQFGNLYNIEYTATLIEKND